MAKGKLLRQAAYFLLLGPAACAATAPFGKQVGTVAAVHDASDRAPTENPHETWWRGYMTVPQIRLPDGRRLTLFCQGKGTPVAILDIGLGGGAWGWSTVQGAMARQTRVCSYDRAGYSNSNPAKTPRTFDALEADLAAMLTAARLRGPYVMVGQSLGGPIVGLFAQRHPGRVAGLVLVDPATGNQTAILSAIAPASDQTASRLAAATACVRAVESGTLFPGSAIEMSCVAPDRPGFEPPPFASRTYRQWQRGANLRARLAEMEGLDFATLHWPRGPRTDTRILVLTRSDGSTEGSKDRAIWSLWNQMHDEVADSSTDGVNCIVPRSTHSMMSSRPDVVIDAVSRMVAAVRGHRRIGSRCGYSG